LAKEGLAYLSLPEYKNTTKVWENKKNSGECFNIGSQNEKAIFRGKIAGLNCGKLFSFYEKMRREM
jgi:hypothetical protein